MNEWQYIQLKHVNKIHTFMAEISRRWRWGHAVAIKRTWSELRPCHPERLNPTNWLHVVAILSRARGIAANDQPPKQKKLNSNKYSSSNY